MLIWAISVRKIGPTFLRVGPMVFIVGSIVLRVGSIGEAI